MLYAIGIEDLESNHDRTYLYQEFHWEDKSDFYLFISNWESKLYFDILVLTIPINSSHFPFLLSLSLPPLGQRLFHTQVFVVSDTPGPRSCLGPLEVAQMQKMQRDTCSDK